MKLILGIDTGGTHTDAVVFNPISRTVLASAKAATTHHNLVEGISSAIANLTAGAGWTGGLQAITQINLSTTLATNSIAEGLSGNVGLILMGYDADHAAVKSLVQKLPLVETVFVSGSHNYYGQEDEPLDEAALEAAAKAMVGRVSGWAVSGFFSVKNPGHELRAAAILNALTDKPVTMGHDLTGEYDAVRRAVTAALNAGLVVIINGLMDAVNQAAASHGLTARLMVVKGDGSLVSEEWARKKPIETVVSGPAASLLGAGILGRGFLKAAEKDLWVMDVGGTTTDMAFVENGRPVVTPNGARVGQWKTMATAVETRTRGLGGDSLVSFGREGRIILGPRRVLPLCRLAGRWPEVTERLSTQKNMVLPATLAGVFFLPGAPADSSLNQDETDILKSLEKETPLPLAAHAENCFNFGRRFGGLAALRHPAVLISAFTPTDAMSILGLYNQGDREAAVLGAQILGRSLRLGPDELATLVLEEFGRLLAMEIVSYGFDGEGVAYDDSQFDAQGILGAALGLRVPGRIRVKLETDHPVLLLGAPAAVLAPFLERGLSGRVLVPPSHALASAVGAAAAPVHLSRRVEIHTLPCFQGFRLFLPDGAVDGETVDDLVAVAEDRMSEHMRRLATLAGADKARVSCVREDRLVRMNEGDSLNLGASLYFTVDGQAA